MVRGPGFRVQGLGFRVQGLGSKVQGSGSRVWLTRVSGLGHRFCKTANPLPSEQGTISKALRIFARGPDGLRCGFRDGGQGFKERVEGVGFRAATSRYPFFAFLPGYPWKGRGKLLRKERDTFFSWFLGIHLTVDLGINLMIDLGINLMVALGTNLIIDLCTNN